MIRTPYWQAVWQANRTLPLLLAGLLLLNLLLYAALVTTVFPAEEELEREFLAVQSQSRGHATPRLNDAEALKAGQTELDRFYASIPPRAEFSALIGDLYRLAGESGLLLTQISYQPKELSAEGLLTYTLNFSVAGTYPQLKRFIHGLEQSSRLIMIESLGLKGEAASDDGEGVTLDLRLTTYFRGAAS